MSQDPNNTAWARSTDTYGHRILSAQGWKQGEYLGARDANHADHYTAANASHIRILLREENLGLGAQVGKANAETFGLSMFSGLLGRLNGKSEDEVQTQQNLQRDVQLKTFHAQKYGAMNFVSGGLLVGDKIEFASTNDFTSGDADIQTSATERRDKKLRNRKVLDEAVHDADTLAVKKRKSNRKNGSKSQESVNPTEVQLLFSGQTKERRERTSNSPPQAENSTSTEDKDSGGNTLLDVDSEIRKQSATKKSARARDEKSSSKHEKRARKEERRKRKEEKRRRKGEKSILQQDQSNSATPLPESEATISIPSTARSVAIASGGRHAVRQRYIQQKRLASMNPQALKEIFMLKATS